MMKRNRPALRAGLGVAVALSLSLVLSGCSESKTAPEMRGPAADETEVTSDSGLITMYVPDSWDDALAEVQSQIHLPGIQAEFAWVLDGTINVDASSVIIVSYDDPNLTSSAFAEQTFSTIRALYPTGDVVVRDSIMTMGGVEFERQDLTDTVFGLSVYQMELAAVVDGQGIEIAVTLFGDADRLVDDVVRAVETVIV